MQPCARSVFFDFSFAFVFIHLMPNTQPSSRFSTLHLTVLACAVAVLGAGCSNISETLSSSKVDYRTSGKKTVNLEIPPDLVQLSGQGRYTHASGGVVSAADFDKQGQTVQNTSPQIATTSQGGVTLEREGQQRWLSVNKSPDQIWALVSDFWSEQGFELATNLPQSGLLETNWSENRAKLGEDGLRNLVGNVLDKLYDTGERDQFRTRVERTAKGSEIYISHRGLTEVYTDANKLQTTWKARPSDANLETIMLTKLMGKLGATKEETVEAASKSTAAPSRDIARARVLPDGVTVALDSKDFDQAWRRVNLALDRGGFTVEDRDRSKGLFEVRLVSSNEQQKGGGMLDTFKGWFGSKPNSDNVVRYRLQLTSLSTGSTVVIQGQDNSGMKQVARLLTANLE